MKGGIISGNNSPYGGSGVYLLCGDSYDLGTRTAFIKTGGTIFGADGGSDKNTGGGTGDTVLIDNIIDWTSYDKFTKIKNSTSGPADNLSFKANDNYSNFIWTGAWDN
ncbi:MAG: hypothetical protein FWD78_03160 [Treponema sp.]|nr:hypothetical protein [Treponema sp.]